MSAETVLLFFTQLGMDKFCVHMLLLFKGFNVHGLLPLCYLVEHATQN